jgi:DNA-binding transcriptional regulator LsrR (DeoR family)
MSADETAARNYSSSLAARAAWLHYAAGMTQAQVAKRLGLSSLKAHRLITRANQEGLVRIFVDGEVRECIELEERLSTRFGLEFCEVVPDFDQDDLPLRALGIAGAQFLKREIDRGDNKLIGVGHGRTLAASVEYLPRLPAVDMRFVSLFGGLTRKFAANPHDVIHRLADRTGAQAYVMPVPFFANTVEDRDILLGQRGVSEVFELALASSLMFVGIGTAEREASLVATGMIELAEIDDVKRDGGVGEVLGHFFASDGAYVETGLSSRMITLGRDQLKDRNIVAIAGGQRKVAAIGSILKSGYLKGLITDEKTADAVIRETAGTPSANRKPGNGERKA